MSIPARQIVAVTPRLLTAGGTDFVINGMFLTKNTLIPLTSRAISFTSSDSVGDYFGETSTEYTTAVSYFSGYNNSYKKPEKIFFGAYVDGARSAWLRSATYTGTLATLKAITSGSIKLSVNGVEKSITGIDLSSASSFSSVATLIATAINNGSAIVAVTYSSINGCFTIETTATGASATITFASATTSGTDLGVTLGFTQTLGAVISQGSDTQTFAQNMTAIIASNNNWGTFTTIFEQTDEEIVTSATWVAAQNGDYLYMPWSNEGALTQVGAVTNIAKTLDAMEATGTSGNYSLEDSIFAISTWASIDWNRENAMVTSAFKKQSGRAAEIEDATSASLLVDEKWNFYGNYATRNDNFLFYYEGRMFGDYGYQDVYIGAMWLNNALQLAIMNALTTHGRIPYTPTGYELLRNAMLRTIQRAKKNGVIDAGLELSDTQKSELTIEYGNDSIIDELATSGYCILIEDAGAETRTNRQSPSVSLWYTYGGSIHRVNIVSTAVI